MYIDKFDCEPGHNRRQFDECTVINIGWCFIHLNISDALFTKSHSSHRTSNPYLSKLILVICLFQNVFFHCFYVPEPSGGGTEKLRIIGTDCSYPVCSADVVLLTQLQPGEIHRRVSVVPRKLTGRCNIHIRSVLATFLLQTVSPVSRLCINSEHATSVVPQPSIRSSDCLTERNNQWFSRSGPILKCMYSVSTIF